MNFFITLALIGLIVVYSKWFAGTVKKLIPKIKAKISKIKHQHNTNNENN